MCPFVQPILEQLKVIIADEKNTDNTVREVQKKVVDGEEALDPADTSSVLNTVHRRQNNELNTSDLMRYSRCWMPVLFADYQMTVFLATYMSFQVCPGLSICRTSFGPSGWLWGLGNEMLICHGALAADEMALRKTFTLVSAPMISKLITEKVVMGLPLSILCGNTLAEWEMLAHIDFPSIVGAEWEWYPFQRLNSVTCRLLEIETTPLHRHPILVSALN